MVRVPEKFQLFPKIDVSLNDCSSAAFLNYMSAAVRSETDPPTVTPRTRGTRRGHERPPPAIVFGKHDETHDKIIPNKNLKIIFSNVACSEQDTSLTGTSPPPCSGKAQTHVPLCNHHPPWSRDGITPIHTNTRCLTGHDPS
jgi:hypothetical protein